MEMKRYALKVFYNGRNFSGSQIQPNKRTVEGKLQNALSQFGNIEKFQCAGRTDRGVSALGNVFAVSADFELIPRAVNSKLPDDICILAAARVPLDFKARKLALERVYRYFLVDRGYDINAIEQGVRKLKGKHSFHNFSKTSKEKDPVRVLNSIIITKTQGFIVLTFSGKSFLWQMIRRIVTALKKIGSRELEPDDIEKYLDPGFKNKFRAAEPEPLVLWDVVYPVKFNTDSYCMEDLRKRLIGWQEQLRRDLIIMEEIEGSLKD